MNHYPLWKNLLVLGILLLGILLALPNIYGSGPAVQMARAGDAVFNEAKLEEVRDFLGAESNPPEAAYLEDGRIVLRFTEQEQQASARQVLDQRYGEDFGVASTLASRMPEWLRNLGLKPMSLGLDLRGGVYFLLEVDMDSAVNSRLQNYKQSFDNGLTKAKIRRRVTLEDQTITVRINRAEQLEDAREVIRSIDGDILILDGGDGKSLRVRMTETQIKARQDFAIDQNITTLRNRVNQLGVAEPLVQRQGTDRIVVQLPGVQDPNQLDKILTATATLEFRLVVENDAGNCRVYKGRGDIPDRCLKNDVIASGDQIVDAESGFSEGSPAVFITLDASGGAKMLETTRNNLGKPMAVVFIEADRNEVIRDGVTTFVKTKTEEMINVATIRGIFKNSFQVTGLTPLEARDLALLLRAGALAAPVYKVEERTIGPTLGKDNIDRGFMAVKIGFLAVIVFMALYYRWFGVIANLALFANLVLIAALLSLLQASLTLPGIAGIVLTVGMAVDANVLIFERIREELANGVSPQAAISAGYEKAFSSIADANITTLIAAVVLFAFGTGPIKGFAITLSLGIITSMFTAIVGTRAVANLAFGGRKLTGVPV